MYIAQCTLCNVQCTCFTSIIISCTVYTDIPLLSALNIFPKRNSVGVNEGKDIRLVMEPDQNRFLQSYGKQC